MRIFCGWIGAPGGSAGREAATRMLGSNVEQGGVALADGARWLLAVLDGPGPAVVDSEPGETVLMIGAVHRNAQTHAGSSVPPNVKKWLLSVPEGVDKDGPYGHFALARIGQDGAEATLVVDRFSTLPIYYASIPEGIVFGSSPRIVALHPLVGTTIREQALFDFIYASAIPQPETVYTRVSAIRPGHAVNVSSGAISVHCHWSPRFVDHGVSRVGTRSESEVLDLLRDAVRTSVDGVHDAGCFLSGGIDSSTITGCLTDVGDEKVRTYSIGFDAQGYDEMGYAREVAEHFKAEHYEYYVTPDDIISLIPRIAHAFGQPFGNASVVPAFLCAQLAKEKGEAMLLAGDGGDELFGGNERYGQQWIFSLFGHAPGMLQTLGQSWARSDSPFLGNLPVLRKAVSYIRHTGIPLPGRMDVYNYVHRLGAARVFAREFLSGIDQEHVIRRRSEAFQAARTDNDVNRMLALDFEITLADNDLRKVGVMCREAGIEVKYPFLHDDVVDFSLDLTPDDKVKRTHLRWFFRKAVTGYLPDSVIRKSKHGFGLPFGPWAVSHPRLREWVADAMSGARRRGIINPELLDDLQSGLLEQHPGYYGPLVWLIATLETWMQENP